MTRRTDSPAVFLAPFASGVVLLVLVPAALTVGYAFTSYTGLGAVRASGLDNVRRLLVDPFFADSLRASAIHVALAVPLRLLAAGSLGLMLAAPRPGGRLYRALVYLPTVVPDVALALLFLWVFNPVYGPLNAALGALGLPQPVWLSTPWGARLGIVLMLLLPIGEGFLVVLATRRGLPARLYEAAALEGCSPFGRLRRITLPLLAPVLLLLAARDTVLTLQVNFVPAYLLTDGGPGTSTLYLPIYIYDQAFEFSSFGYAALMTLVLGVLTAAVISLQVLLVRRWRLPRSA